MSALPNDLFLPGRLELEKRKQISDITVTMNRCLSDQGFRGEGGYRVVAGKDEADNVGMDAIPIFDIRIQIFFNLVLENPRKLTY